MDMLIQLLKLMVLYQAFMSNQYGYADDLILMSAIALKDKTAIIDGLYRCDINKNTNDHYTFDLNGRKYFACDNTTVCKWAIELDDSMLA